MQSKFALPIVALSIVGAIAFSVQWIQEQRHVHYLTIATGGKDGEYYAFARALASVVAQHEPNIQITVLESEGATQNVQMLAQGTAQLGIIQSDSAVVPSVRAIAYLFPEVFHLMVPANSKIKQVSDLQGKRVALMPKGSGSYTLFTPLREHYGLAETDLKSLPMSPSDAYAAFKAGQVDALFRVIALGSPSIRALLQTTGARLIPIDQAESLRLSLPYLEASTIPKGTYDGANPIPPEALPVVGVRAVLVTHAGTDPTVVRQITETLFEFRNELVTLYPRSALIRLPESSINLGVPLHTGARAYYNEDRPNFLMAYSDALGLLLSIAILTASGGWQLRQWLIERQKDRADLYNLKILELMNQVPDVQDLAKLQAIRNQLFEIFNTVVIDLDQDRISPESFQSFTFPWEVAISTIRHQEMLLMGSQAQAAHPPEAG
jgi:uncharacterized protein